MITINLEKIEDRRKEIGMSRAELARRVGKEEDTLLKFIKSGKKLKQHIELIENICCKLGIPAIGKDGIIQK